MQYKRLTKRLDNGEIWKFTSDYLILQRLAELEDKIENCTIIEVCEPYIVLDYISNEKRYYAIKIIEEKELFINLTKEEAEAKLKELKEQKE